MVGTLSLAEALALSREQEVDLVEISPKATPPVCKLIDYGKMLYATQKKEQKAKQANKSKEQKGIRITFKMDVGDLKRQTKMTEKFLIEGHGVRVQMRLRGRERAHMDLAIEKMNTFLKSLEDISKIDQPAKPGNGQVLASLTPDKKTGKKTEALTVDQEEKSNGKNLH